MSVVLRVREDVKVLSGIYGGAIDYYWISGVYSLKFLPLQREYFYIVEFVETESVILYIF